MSEKTLFEEGFQTGEITPTLDQLKQQIFELQEKCEKLSSQVFSYEQGIIKEKKTANNNNIKDRHKSRLKKRACKWL